MLDTAKLDSLVSAADLSIGDADLAAQFVAAGLCTQAEADAVLYTISYPAGDVVQASDVTVSRARVAIAAGKAALLAWLDTKNTAAIAACDEGQRGGTLPTKAQLQAIPVPPLSTPAPSPAPTPSPSWSGTLTNGTQTITLSGK